MQVNATSRAALAEWLKQGGAGRIAKFMQPGNLGLATLAGGAVVRLREQIISRAQLPTVTAMELAFQQLEPTLKRCDGKTEEDDRKAEIDAAYTKIEAARAAIEAEGFSRTELEELCALSPRQVSEAYYAEPYSRFRFKVDYYVRTAGFKQPEPYGVEPVTEAGGMTREQYSQMSAADVAARMKRDPAFKDAVARLG
jgi:hypothetical protein